MLRFKSIDLRSTDNLKNQNYICLVYLYIEYISGRLRFLILLVKHFLIAFCDCCILSLCVFT